MPRKSKYIQNTVSSSTLWNTALYVRLSREDGDKSESDSVANQKMMLSSFVESAPDLNFCGFYVDDGFSGTSFVRPSFQRMIEDIHAGKINCVVVKDLSRFGRNYIESGEYIERIFPLLNVRFIAVNDNLDSVKDPLSTNSLLLPVRNLLNDEYSRDISNKIRSSLDTKRKAGKFIGSFASYGYVKDENDRNRLVIDPEAAEVVKRIYRDFLSGKSVLSIARQLNREGVLNPSEYKRQNGMNYNHPRLGASSSLWGDAGVRRILKNRLYTGVMVQGKNRVKSYKIHVTQNVPEKDWFTVPDTHEAIISREDFDAAQQLFKRDTRVGQNNTSVYILSGYVKCGDCLRSMVRKTIHHSYGTYAYYICSTYKAGGECSKHTIRCDVLEDIVLSAIQRQIEKAVKLDEMINSLNNTSIEHDVRFRIQKQMESVKCEIAKIEKMQLDLYPDWKEGAITKQEYLSLKSSFEEKKKELKLRLLKLEEELSCQGERPENIYVSSFIKHRNITSLTREIIVELIDNIYVFDDKKIKIDFKFHLPADTCSDESSVSDNTSNISA